MGLFSWLFGKKKPDPAPSRPRPGTPEFDAEFKDNMLWSAGNAADSFAPQLYAKYLKVQLAVLADQMPMAKVVGLEHSQLMETWDEGMVQGRAEIETAFRDFAVGIGQNLEGLGASAEYDAIVTERVDGMVGKLRQLASEIVRLGLQ